MRNILILLYLTALTSCEDKKPKSLDEAFESCLKKVEAHSKNPTQIEKIWASCFNGVKIPEFNALTIEGKEINRNYFKNKITILNFWFSTCQPCVAEIPGFNLIVTKYGHKNINYLAIGRDNKDVINEFLIKYPWNFEHIPDGNELIENIFKLKTGYPTTYILNDKSEIIYTTFGGRIDTLAIKEIQNKLIPIIDKSL